MQNKKHVSTWEQTSTLCTQIYILYAVKYKNTRITSNGFQSIRYNWHAGEDGCGKQRDISLNQHSNT